MQMNAGLDLMRGNRAVLVMKKRVSEEFPVSLIRNIVKSRRFLIYVSARTGYPVIKEKVEKDLGLTKERVLFVDLVTRTPSDRPERRENCVFTNAPTNLTDVAMALSQALIVYQKTGVVVMIDDLNSLANYNMTPTVIKFVKFVITRSKALGGSVILLYSPSDEMEAITQSIKGEVDEIIVM